MAYEGRVKTPITRLSMKIPFSLHLTVLVTLLAATVKAETSSFEHFNVAVNGYDVTLTWATHSEKARVFEVQVATEADNNGDLTFMSLAELPAGTTTQYEFTDNSPSKEGIRYYRVKQTEVDGTVSYTETATANFQSSETFTLNVSTTNTFTELELDVMTKSTATATVTLTSLVATYTQTSDITVTTGKETHVITVDAKAPNGPYLLSFEMNGAVQLRLITKQPAESMIVGN